ncbi:hypothetical protein PIB30_062316, partial [Stylosanthes scabra]|nr:hypothetical protein [Stylosanthes scabra]
MLELTYAYAWSLHMRTHSAEISNWACRPRLDAYAWLHVMRTHRLQQWPFRFVTIFSFLSLFPATSVPNSACYILKHLSAHIKASCGTGNSSKH